MRQIVDARQAWKLRTLAAELPKRVEAVKRYVAQRVTEDLAGEVGQRAPRGHPNLPSNYPDLEIVAVDDSRGPSYAAVFVGKATRTGALNPASTVLYVRAFDEVDQSPAAKAVRALEGLSPFVMDALPATIPRETGYFTFRKVRPDEVLAVMEKNAADAAKIAEAMRDSGLDPRVDHDEVAAYSDVVFEVLRLEYGLGGEKRPHWRPAVRAVVAGSTMKTLMGDADLAKALRDPLYRGWHKLGIMGDKLTYSDVEPLARFEQKILD